MLRLTKEKKRFLHIRKEKLKKKPKCDDTVVSSAILPAVDSLEEIPSSSNHSGSTIISHHGDVLEPEFRIDEVSLLRESETQLDVHVVYESEIRRTKSIQPLDRYLEKFVFPELDTKSLCLMKSKIIVVQCFQFTVNNENSYSVVCEVCHADEVALISSLDKILSSVPNLIIDDGSDPEEFEVHRLVFDDTKMLININNKPGVVGKTGEKVTCFTCSTKECVHSRYLKGDDIHPLAHDIIACDNVRMAWERECLSKKPIPFTPDQREMDKLIDPLTNYLCQDDDGKLILADCIEKCRHCGDDLITCPTGQQLKVYTKSKTYDAVVINMECKTCGAMEHYDGLDDMIINMGNYGVHHGVLRSYMSYFLRANSMTFTHFYDVWASDMEMFGNSNFRTLMPYQKFIQTWYNFLSLLKVDYSQSMLCGVCGPSPSLVVCDGTSLGFQRKYVNNYADTDKSNIIPRYSSHESRVAIIDTSLREKLKSFGKKEMNPEEITHLLKKIRVDAPYLYGAFHWCYMNFRLDSLSLNSIPDGITNFFKCISSPSPVCCYLFPSYRCSRLLDLMFEVDIKKDVSLFKEIQTKLPIFFNLLKDLHLESRLPDAFKGIVLHLKEKAIIPFQQHVAELPADDDPEEISFFPNLPKVRGRGVYKQDLSKQNSSGKCTKRGSSHQKLTAGIFTVYCQHGICVGFSCMDSAESPNVPFTIFKTRWIEAPSVIVYDNACNLHRYALNRDPVFFKETQFLVDRFHWPNHKACSSAYHIDLYPSLKTVNSQINEQMNSATKNLARQVSYMRKENFLSHCSFFLYFKNMEKKKRNITLRQENE